MRYAMIIEKSADELTDEVESHLRDGWELYGNPVIGYDAEFNRMEYGQAVIKKED